MTTTREKVLTALRERIIAYAASRIGRDFAEDLAQEVLVVLETRYAQVEASDELLPLAFQILRFKMQDWRRKTARRGEFTAVDVNGLALADGHAAPDEELEQRQLEARLVAALSRLEGRCREMFRLKLQGKGFAEIQKELGAAAINTVYTWDFRCRKQLLELLASDGKGGGRR